MGNKDGFKHLSGEHFQINHTGITAMHRGHCAVANRVLTIIGDVNHTLRSTVRRFKLAHVNLLRRNMGKPPLINASVDTVFDLPANELGITHFQTSWLLHMGKPRLRVETTESLYSHPDDVIAWLLHSKSCQ